LNIKKADLWISVYKGDREAFNIWKDYIGVGKSKIVKLGEESNFWPANAPSCGPNGPCGPCAEIFFDRGKKVGCGKGDCSPDCDCGRFVEVWNLVFTQFNRVGKDKLDPLPQKNIDTGMGLERMVCVLQGVKSNFEIDIFNPVVALVKEILQVTDSGQRTSSLINAIVDHGRAAVFAIADGIYPSNEERGYVIRKIIRKASWNARLLKRKDIFLYRLVSLFSDLMEDAYPEIHERGETIAKVISAEEEKFLSAIRDGENQLSVVIEGLRNEKKDTICADDLFRLYDTYGLPVELSKEMAQLKNLKIDEAGFETCLRQQRERSRKGSMFDENIFKEGGGELRGASRFTGYDEVALESRIVALRTEDKEIEALKEGEEGFVILDKTPFYPEGGGQLADTGIIETKGGRFIVGGVFKIGEVIIHKGKVRTGKIVKGKAVSSVDVKRRCALMRAHTATHLTQAALRKVLGEHVVQQGSLVDEDKLRFDFTHFKALTQDELTGVERLVNQYILNANEVCKKIISYDRAKREGALAFFKDKYKGKVRVVAVSEYSKELCAGTHLDNTSKIGSFVILSESSISSGVRRIEAIVGGEADRFLRNSRDSLREVTSFLKCRPQDLKGAIGKLLAESKKDKQTIANLSNTLMSLSLEEIICQHRIEINKVNFLPYIYEAGLASKAEGSAAIGKLSDKIKEKLGSVFVFIATEISGGGMFICSATDDLAARGVSCRKFVSAFGEELALKGGGRDNFVQGVILNRDSDFLSKVKDCFSRFVK